MKPLEQKLLKLLSNNDVTFYIPPYQRNYEWTEEQCNIFFEDVVKTRDKNVSGNLAEHFFGTITYFQTETVFGQPNKLILIDGQQRITTTMLFLTALRDLLQDQSLKKFINTSGSLQVTFKQSPRLLILQAFRGLCTDYLTVIFTL